MLLTPAGRALLRRRWIRPFNPLIARMALVRRRLWGRRIRVITIVGSFGKTTTNRMIVHALGYAFKPYMALNASVAIPRSILRHPPWRRRLVVETSVNAPGLVEDYVRLLRPDVAVATMIGSEHIRSHGTLENAREQKVRMLRALPADGLAVINGDNPHTRWMATQTQARVITFGLGADCDVRAEEIHIDFPEGTRFRLLMNGSSYDARIRMIGKTMVMCALGAIATAVAEGVAPETALERIGALKPTGGRMQPVKLPNGAWLINDCYKGALETIEEALDVLSQIPARRKVIVIGQISEPPGSQGPLYRALGERIAGIADRLIVYGRATQRYGAGAARAGMPRDQILDADRDPVVAAQLAAEGLEPGDIVLLKGRDTERLDRVALLLQGETMRCRIPVCDFKVIRCHECPKRWKGWGSGGGTGNEE